MTEGVVMGVGDGGMGVDVGVVDGGGIDVGVVDGVDIGVDDGVGDGVTLGGGIGVFRMENIVPISKGPPVGVIP